MGILTEIWKLYTPGGNFFISMCCLGVLNLGPWHFGETLLWET